ncbi:MAG: helix-turn-helix domain-containing protein [Clostridia bacterium]|nr:helix-turn-helix domain-containing protein [Clostridia bacterium]
MKDILIIKPEHRLSIKRHSHDTYEIIYYTDGKGVMHTSSGSLSFAAGNIIVVPPYTEHESSSQDGFGFYSLRGEFEGVLHFPEPILLRDNENNEALTLLSMINRNRIHPGDYQHSLVRALLHFILQNARSEDSLTLAVRHVATTLSEQFHSSDLSIVSLFRESGYAEDYIRAHFKKIYGKTPTDFLNSLRINHAILLIDTYKHAFTLSEIALHCGFTDYIYFSRKFKQQVGVSPTAYKKQHKHLP